MKKENKIIKLLKFKSFFYNHKMKHIAKLFDHIHRIIFASDIPASVKLGKNIQLPHYGLGIVIHPKSTIGDNCKIFQNVTIGCRNGDGPPIIGNNVFIGSGACILGKIKIGDNAKIGANAVVLKDVLPNETVVGIPAKVIKK